ncbi:hypothetical protein [Pedobacter heparinus]|uniref:hypothetical protein n=1 Tax=Pedobacter heparinus TaxID=984 RepID=UPI0029302AFD|nr:hypothetical protein [Pedobacter heparinus]
MKTLKTAATYIFVLFVSLTACKKDNAQKEDENLKFDINNPVGYFIYVKYGNGTTVAYRSWLFEFQPGKTLKFYDSEGNGSNTYTYEIIDGNIVGIKKMDFRFTIDDGKITSDDPYLKDLALIKASQTNQLAGKTFAGTYYDPRGAVLHKNFFYSFAAKDNKVGAGLNIGTVLRTENYSSIGNIAAWVDIAGNDDGEFMVLVNGKLEVSYYQKTPYALHSGSFSQQ